MVGGGGHHQKSRRAPQPPPRALRGATVHELSVVAAFDELARNAGVLSEGKAEEAMLKLVRRSATWAKRWREADLARREQAEMLRDKDREILARENKIKQARNIVEEERKGRLQAEAERDTFAKQVRIRLPHNILYVNYALFCCSSVGDVEKHLVGGRPRWSGQ